MSAMRNRAGVLLVEDGRVALIRRRRGSLVFYVFPGGGVDAGEDFADAARREAHEELGVEVDLLGATVRMRTPGEHRYWRARVTGGTFGQARGHEFTRKSPWSGSYRAVWMPLDELEAARVIPRSLAAFVVGAERDGWPSTDVTLIEWAWLERGPEQRSADPFVNETAAVVTATLEDVPAWLALAREVRTPSATATEDASLEATLKESVATRTAFVARENWGAPGTPLAGAMLWTPEHNRIAWLAVGQRWQRRGIGSALVAEAIATATGPSITVVSFDEHVAEGAAARSFYAAHGFAITGRTSVPNRHLVELVLERP